MAEHPEFTQEMKDAGAVYLGWGKYRRGKPMFAGWSINRSAGAHWVGGGRACQWVGDSENLRYAIHPDDPNFEAVCWEFGVPRQAYGDFLSLDFARAFDPPWQDGLTDLTAVAPPPGPPLTLPTDSAERKNYPLYRGLMRYFPAALAGVAKHSKEGNDKHNPGEPMHHARGKSNDHADCILRHLMDLADLEMGEDFRGMEMLTEANALAWRALALSQEIHEQLGAPMAPGAEE